MPANPIFVARALRKTYGSGATEVAALREVSLEIAAGEFVVLLAIPDGESGEEKLEKIGLMTYEDDGKVLIDSVTFGSPAAEAGLEFDQQILRVRAPTDRWPKEFMWIPGFLLFGLIVWMQRRRRQR